MVLSEGFNWHELKVKELEPHQKFEGWVCDGPGTIQNAAAKTTSFLVGNGSATITALINDRPDKKLTIYWRHPSTNEDTLVSSEYYRYGSKVVIEAAIAPDKSTFLSWLGDVDNVKPSALASTISIDNLTTDTTLVATYFYPESPQYYTLTVYDGYPENGSFPTGSLVTVTAKEPSQNWEFYKWEGDVRFLVNPDVTAASNAVIMPARSITLKAKYNIIGQEPLYRVSVTGGTASITVTPEDGEPYDVSGTYLDLPFKSEVTLTADPDVVRLGI